jgi:hypothetical protein
MREHRSWAVIPQSWPNAFMRRVRQVRRLHPALLANPLPS